MTAWQLLTTTWHWEPSIWLGCTALLGGYLAVLRFRLGRRALLFVAGVLALLLALVSPLDTLGDTYLFSAHMVQHLLLVLVTPPLMLLGLPADPVRQWLRQPALNRLERFLGRAGVAWLLGAGTLWLWHIPAFYNASLAHLDVHIAMHLSFLITATIFWWLVAGPLPERRLSPLAAVAYLFTAGVANTVLGIILTFAPPGLYPAYLHPFDTLGILSLLREQWGLTPAVDQQLGGLLMWIPGGLIYLGTIVGLLVHWLNEAPAEEADLEARPLISAPR